MSKSLIHKVPVLGLEAVHVGAGELHAVAADVAEEVVVAEVDAEAARLQHDPAVATVEIWKILNRFHFFQDTVKLGYNELGCWRTLGYNEHIFKKNWSF